MRKIPFFGNDRETEIYGEVYQKLSQEVWRTGQFLNGPWVEQFEKSIAAFCGRKFAVALGSCTDALIFGLEALDLELGSLIIVPDFSFIASASPILLSGHRPIFCDVSKETAMISLETLHKLDFDQEKPRGLIAVSLFGSLAPMDQLQDYCGLNNIILIEDAAQSLGATFNSQPAGSFGKFSTLSFDPTKTLHATGAGGCLLTDDQDIYEKVLEKRLHGRDKLMSFSGLGRKSLLPSHDANILNFKLNELSNWISRRREIANRYERAIDSNSFLKNLVTIEKSTHTYHKFVFQCRNKRERELLQEQFKESQITTRVHYDLPLSHNTVFSQYKRSNSNALELSQNVLSLPIFHELRDEEVDQIVAVLEDFSPTDTSDTH